MGDVLAEEVHPVTDRVGGLTGEEFLAAEAPHRPHLSPRPGVQLVDDPVGVGDQDVVMGERAGCEVGGPLADRLGERLVLGGGDVEQARGVLALQVGALVGIERARKPKTPPAPTGWVCAGSPIRRTAPIWAPRQISSSASWVRARSSSTSSAGVP
jgi:hypothetical protein